MNSPRRGAAKHKIRGLGVETERLAALAGWQRDISNGRQVADANEHGGRETLDLRGSGFEGWDRLVRYPITCVTGRQSGAYRAGAASGSRDVEVSGRFP